jgi:hypothetical protein
MKLTDKLQAMKTEDQVTKRVFSESLKYRDPECFIIGAGFGIGVKYLENEALKKALTDVIRFCEQFELSETKQETLNEYKQLYDLK